MLHIDFLFGEQPEKMWCEVCCAYIKKTELDHWTGDDSYHWLCPGCGSDMLPVLAEDEYLLRNGITPIGYGYEEDD